MTPVDKNNHIGICLYLQTYVELSTYRVNEICKILSSVLESLSSVSTLAIPDSSTSSVPNMVRQLLGHMRTVSSSLTFLMSCLQRLLKKPGYLLPLCLMLPHLSKISVLISRFAVILAELQTTCPNIVVNLRHSKTHMWSLASLLNVLGSSVRELDSDMLLIYRNVLELYIHSMDSLITSNFPNLERHITQIQRSLYPLLEYHI